MIRIRCIESYYSPPNIAYIHQTATGWRCTMANGIPVAFSYGGIGADEMACLFGLEDCETAEQALAVILSCARRYEGGPKAGKTVFDYEITA